MAPPTVLGRVAIAGQDQFITRLDAKRPGRRRGAPGRRRRRRRQPARRRPARGDPRGRLGPRLPPGRRRRCNLPPGLAPLRTPAAPTTSPTPGCSSWTLLDLFLVLVIALAVGAAVGPRLGRAGARRRWCSPSPRPDAPRWAWLGVLGGRGARAGAAGGQAARSAGRPRPRGRRSVVHWRSLARPFLVDAGARRRSIPRSSTPGRRCPAQPAESGCGRRRGGWRPADGERRRRLRASVRQGRAAVADALTRSGRGSQVRQSQRRRQLLLRNAHGPRPEGDRPDRPRPAALELDHGARSRWRGPGRARRRRCSSGSCRRAVNLRALLPARAPARALALGLLRASARAGDLGRAPRRRRWRARRARAPARGRSRRRRGRRRDPRRRRCSTQLRDGCSSGPPASRAAPRARGSTSTRRPAALELRARGRRRAPATAVPLPGGAPALDSGAGRARRQAGRGAPARAATASSGSPSPPGVHQVLLDGAAARTARRCSSAAAAEAARGSRREPRAGRVDGLHEDGLADDEPAAHPQARSRGRRRRRQRWRRGLLPPFVRVERDLVLGLRWQVETRVDAAHAARRGGRARGAAARRRVGDHRRRARRGRQGAGQPRPAGERGRLALGARGAAADRASRAPTHRRWTEVWRLDASPIWHVALERHSGRSTRRRDDGARGCREWRPWPGESRDRRGEPARGRARADRSPSTAASSS